MEGFCREHDLPKAAKPVRIFDAFMFNSELDMLEVRLLELYDFVDYFVICKCRAPRALTLNLILNYRLRIYLSNDVWCFILSCTGFRLPACMMPSPDNCHWLQCPNMQQPEHQA